jgi:hypothetical protein
MSKGSPGPSGSSIVTVTQAERPGWWAAFWFRPESPRNLAAARILLAATGLWMVLSRPDLPSVETVPGLWASVGMAPRLRFFAVFGLDVERALYAVLHVALALALLGVVPRLTCFLSGLLLYHFGPFETLHWTTNPYLRGFTIPALGLLILSVAPCGDALALRRGSGRAGPAPAWQYRWPLALVEVLFSQIYFFAGYAKIVANGLDWITAANIRGHLLVLNQVLTASPQESWGYVVAQYSLLCGAIAWAGMLFDLGFPLVLVSRVARWLFLPAALVFHVLNSVLFRIFFQNVGLLLVFVDWNAVLRSRRAG